MCSLTAYRPLARSLFGIRASHVLLHCDTIDSLPFATELQANSVLAGGLFVGRAWFHAAGHDSSHWRGRFDMCSVLDAGFRYQCLLLGAALICCSTVGPVLSMASWAYIWGATLIGKLDSVSVQTVLQMSPYLYSWCGLDVMWISIFAGALEMDLPTQWIVEHNVGYLCAQIKDTVHEPCVHVDGHLPTGGWLLFVAALLTCMTFLLTMKAFGHPALSHGD